MRIRQSKGITLISLIITIIILIILTGVCINLVFSENGLIKRIKISKIEYEKALILEELESAKAPIMIDEEGIVNIEKYLQAIEEKELNGGYKVTRINKKDEINAEIWVEGKYKYTVTQIGTNVIINIEGYVENSKLEIDINIEGQEMQQNLPIVLTAQIDQTQTNNLLNIDYVGYTINSLKENIGTDKKNYIETTLDDNMQFQLNINETGQYYIHSLCINNVGNSLEIIKGPIIISENYHNHIGTSEEGKGCYTIPIYTYGVGKGISNASYTVNGIGYIRYGCADCGLENVSNFRADGSQGYTWSNPPNHQNCPAKKTLSGYNLGCGKDETTIEGYKVSFY